MIPEKTYRRSAGVDLFFHAVFLGFAFWFSYLFSGAYQLGDQVFYRELYSSLADASIDEISANQVFYTGSSEPVYGMVAWFGARLGIDKDVYFSIFNALFCDFLLLLLLRSSAKKLFIILTFSNFYLFVLLAPAERLKMAFLIVLLGLLFKGLKSRLALLGTSFLCHFQMLLLFGAWAFSLVPQIANARWFNKKNIARWLTFSIVFAVIFSWFYSTFAEVLFAKFESYHSGYKLESAFNIIILMALTPLIFRKKWPPLFALLLTAVTAGVVGPERVNMIGFFLFAYFAVGERKTGHSLVVILMLYFAVKGLIFMSDVFRFGTGF